jgi:prophage antirepressor-like protein
MVGRAGQPQGWPVLRRYFHPRSVCHPSVERGVAVQYRNRSTTTMTSPSTGASAPAVFHFNSQAITVILKDGDPWFIASEVLAALELHRTAIRRLEEDEKGVHKTHTLGGEQAVTIISEPGLYRLIGRSNKPAAKAFNRWLCHDVLPAIRKTGRYEAATAAPPAPSLLNRRWLHIFDHKGRERVTPIDPEDFLTNLREFPELIRDVGFLATGDELAEIIRACADRMAAKLLGGAKPIMKGG